jgi:hypothetical protein
MSKTVSSLAIPIIRQAAYKFIAPGNYRAEVTINYILFAPVLPDVAKFNIVVT